MYLAMEIFLIGKAKEICESGMKSDLLEFCQEIRDLYTDDGEIPDCIMQYLDQNRSLQESQPTQSVRLKSLALSEIQSERCLLHLAKASSAFSVQA